jgi:8-oxo-dGTP pyrophosphatase MutT (NUDIX family)
MANSSEWIRQSAAIPLLDGRVCLVTSSGGNRWVVPKGHLEPRMSAGEVALQEAWEEAGLVGVLRSEPAGTYLYEQFGNLYHVTAFVLNVTEAADEWPESSIRKRLWLDPPAALARLQERGLRELVRAVAAVPHLSRA